MFQLLRSIQIGQNCSEFYCLECISEKEVYIVYIFLLTKKLSKFRTPAGENRPCDEWSNKLLHNTRAETILIWNEDPSFPYCPLSFAAWNRQHQRVGCAPPPAPLLHNTRDESILICKEGPSFPYCPLSSAVWDRQHYFTTPGANLSSSATQIKYIPDV